MHKQFSVAATLIMLTFSTIAGVPGALKDAVKARVEFGLSPAIVIGVYDNGESEFYSYGTTNITGGVPVNENTVFEIGSATKVFVATLLAEQVSQGHIHLDDEITDFLPANCRSDKLGQITFEMLATHYSGLPRMPPGYAPPYYDLHPLGYTRQALCAYLKAPEELAPAGQTYDYSNLGAGLLAELLVDAEGVSFNQLIQIHIAAPLNMQSTAVGIENVDKKQLAQGHSGHNLTAYFPDGALQGSGAVLSSANDMLSFVSAYMHPSSTPLSDAMQLTLQIQRNAWEGTDIGLGWHIQHTQSHKTLYWHNGGTGGYKSFVGFDPDSKKAIVVLANAGGDGNDDLGFAYLDAAQKIKPVPAFRQVAIKSEILQRYTGVYDTEFGVPIDITFADGFLLAKFGEQFALRLYPASESEFFYRAIDASVSFIDDGERSSLVLHQDGEDYPAIRR